MSLVIMEASLHTDHRVAGDVIEDHVTFVTFYCKEGGREGGRDAEGGRETEVTTKCIR